MKKNPKITRAKIGLDFSAQFKIPTICENAILFNKKEIKAFVDAVP